MIRYEGIEVDDLNTEGFEASLPSPMTIRIAPGIISNTREVDVVRTFPEIEFDVVADDELTVIYDVYLLSENNEDGVNVHLDRTEIGPNVIAVYEGTAPMFHTLTSISVPPGTTSLDNIDIEIRTLNKKEASTDETTT